MAQYERTIIELVESATRTIKTAPLVLGGNGGAGGGVGTPPGGFVGQLPQYRVSYDTTEEATSDTSPSGVAGISGWSLVDNLNHIRYRLGQLESGSGVVAGSGITITDDNTFNIYDNTTNLHFTGSGVIVTDLGGGDVQIEINATGSGGTSLTVMESDGSPSVSNVDTIKFSGAAVSDLGNGDVLVTVIGSGGGISDAPSDGNTYGRKDGTWVTVSGTSESLLHYYNDDLTTQSGPVFTTTYIYASGTLRLYYNGIRQRKGIHYLDDIEFTTFSTYFDVYSGDVILADYDYYLSQQITVPVTALIDADGTLLVDSNGIQLTESL